MGFWQKIKDTAKEVFTLGKATTQTYNPQQFQQQQTPKPTVSQPISQPQSNPFTNQSIGVQPKTTVPQTSQPTTQTSSRPKGGAGSAGGVYDASSGVFTDVNGLKYSMAMAPQGSITINQNVPYNPNLAMQQAQAQPQQQALPQSTQAQPVAPGQTLPSGGVSTQQPDQNMSFQELSQFEQKELGVGEAGGNFWAGADIARAAFAHPIEAIQAGMDPNRTFADYVANQFLQKSGAEQAVDVAVAGVNYASMVTAFGAVTKFMKGASLLGNAVVAEGGAAKLASQSTQAAGKIDPWLGVGKITTVAKNSKTSALSTNAIKDALLSKGKNPLTIGTVIGMGTAGALGSIAWTRGDIESYLKASTELQTDLLNTGDPAMIALADEIQKYNVDVKDGLDTLLTYVPVVNKLWEGHKVSKYTNRLQEINQLYELNKAKAEEQAKAEIEAQKAAEAQAKIDITIQQDAAKREQELSDAATKRQQQLEDEARKREQELADLADKRAYDAATLAEKRAYDEAQKAAAAAGQEKTEFQPSSSLNFGLLRTSGGQLKVGSKDSTEGTLVTDVNTVANYYFPGVPYDQLTAQQKALIQMMVAQQ